MLILRILILGLIAPILGCATAPSNYDIPIPIVTWVQSNVWKINREDGGGTGSGFWISNTQMITACHVATDHKSIQVEDRLKQYDLVLEVTACDEESDLALLTFTGSSEFKPMETIISIEDYRQGTATWGGGYSKSETLIITFGHLQSEDVKPSIGKLTTTPTAKGASGSPLLALKDGKVVVIGVRVAMRGSMDPIVEVTPFGLRADPLLLSNVSVHHIVYIKTCEAILKFLEENS